MSSKKIDLNHFNFEDFKEEALSQIKSGQSLTGKDGILTPLIKQLLEAALEGEMDSHLNDCHQENMPNRRNGKMSNVVPP